MELGEGAEKGVLASGLQGLGEDGIRVMVIKDHDVLIATARRAGKTAGLVTVDLSCEIDKTHGHTVGSNVIGRGRCHNTGGARGCRNGRRLTLR